MALWPAVDTDKPGANLPIGLTGLNEPFPVDSFPNPSRLLMEELQRRKPKGVLAVVLPVRREALATIDALIAEHGPKIVIGTGQAEAPSIDAENNRKHFDWRGFRLEQLFKNELRTHPWIEGDTHQPTDGWITAPLDDTQASDAVRTVDPRIAASVEAMLIDGKIRAKDIAVSAAHTASNFYCNALGWRIAVDAKKRGTLATFMHMPAYADAATVERFWPGAGLQRLAGLGVRQEEIPLLPTSQAADVLLALVEKLRGVVNAR